MNIKELAKKLNLSITTVSRGLNDYSDVSIKTKERIKKFAKKYNYKPNDFPIAKRLFETVITLPLYPKMTNEQTQYIISTLMDLWHQYK